MQRSFAVSTRVLGFSARQGGGVSASLSVARKAVARALRPWRGPSMATTSAGGISHSGRMRLSRPSARSSATFHSERPSMPTSSPYGKRGRVGHASSTSIRECCVLRRRSQRSRPWSGDVSTASELALDRLAYESLIGGRSLELSTFLRVVRCSIAKLNRKKTGARLPPKQRGKAVRNPRPCPKPLCSGVPVCIECGPRTASCPSPVRQSGARRRGRCRSRGPKNRRLE